MEECNRCENCLYREQCSPFEKLLNKNNCDEYTDINNFDSDNEPDGAQWFEMSWNRLKENSLDCNKEE